MQEDLGGILLNLPWTFHSNRLKAHHFSLLFLKSTPAPYSFLIKWHHDPPSCPSQDVGIILIFCLLMDLLPWSHPVPFYPHPLSLSLKKNTLTTSCLAFFNSLLSVLPVSNFAHTKPHTSVRVIFPSHKSNCVTHWLKTFQSLLLFALRIRSRLLKWYQMVPKWYLSIQPHYLPRSHLLQPEQNED